MEALIEHTIALANTTTSVEVFKNTLRTIPSFFEITRKPIAYTKIGHILLNTPIEPLTPVMLLYISNECALFIEYTIESIVPFLYAKSVFYSCSDWYICYCQWLAAARMDSVTANDIVHLHLIRKHMYCVSDDTIIENIVLTAIKHVLCTDWSTSKRFGAVPHTTTTICILREVLYNIEHGPKQFAALVSCGAGINESLYSTIDTINTVDCAAMDEQGRTIQCAQSLRKLELLQTTTVFDYYTKIMVWICQFNLDKPDINGVIAAIFKHTMKKRVNWYHHDTISSVICIHHTIRRAFCILSPAYNDAVDFVDSTTNELFIPKPYLNYLINVSLHMDTPSKRIDYDIMHHFTRIMKRSLHTSLVSPIEQPNMSYYYGILSTVSCESTQEKDKRKVREREEMNERIQKEQEEKKKEEQEQEEKEKKEKEQQEEKEKKEKEQQEEKEKKEKEQQEKEQREKKEKEQKEREDSLHFHTHTSIRKRKHKHSPYQSYRKRRCIQSNVIESERLKSLYTLVAQVKYLCCSIDEELYKIDNHL